ncbi:MAG TPA: formylmethanofuran dehydrogenase subunit C [Gemmatimonadales bacterium]|nr:formylmethanofuran dehydrogenase subunit C [Gemmatimonadales bacterium]
MTGGLVAQLKTALPERGDFGEVLAQPWATLSAREMAERPVYLERGGRVRLGDLFDLTGQPMGRIRFVGDLQSADRLGAGLSEGEVTVEGNVGQEAGLALAGGSLDIRGDAGPRAGAAPLGYKRGMTGGELIVRGSAGPEAGAAMRRGLLVVYQNAGERTGLGMIAGTVIVFGTAGRETGLWSKRGSVVALGRITPPATYLLACTYQPPILRLMLTRLSTRYGLSVQRKHLTGSYRRYSGDMAELGKGEILEWVAK